ncbi:MAG: ribosome assembly cofactor RimP [Spirochaetaceae bacterium]|nr:MAG: ribosome assembly cofactor RimP [Spirochaetaceae bacterium]
MNTELHDQLQSEVEPIVSGMGFSLVELRHSRSKNQNHIILVVYRSEGVGVDDCAAISKNLYPRLELIEGLENLQLQVSSPGLDRVLKSESEYSIFLGRNIKVMLTGESEWIRGSIESAQPGVIILSSGGTRKRFLTAEIRKAKLDS